MSLDELITAFFDKDFSFKKAIESLGVSEQEQEAFITLTPKMNSNVAQAKLEKMILRPGMPAFLAGIHLEFGKPVNVHVDDLTRRFGVGHEMPGLDPEDVEQVSDTVMYRWTIKNDDFLGYLILEGVDDADLVSRRYRALVLRRFPPELWKYSAVIEMGLPPYMIQAAIPQT